jgi:FlaA1/EpsC-like NDP-sugar epimerase
MFKTYIIGSGFLSSKLKRKILGSEIYTANDFNNKLNQINKKDKKFNLIINSFYSSRKLNDLESYEKFIKKSLLEVAIIFDNIKPSLINKVIYTSSSSVYGSIGGTVKNVDKNNRYIYSSLKVSAENLIKNFCNKNRINFNICRLFNLYGNNENFSIISKIINRNSNKKKITIFNNGESVRDFIHVDDIIFIYEKLLKKKDCEVYDVGTGRGIKIKDIINSLDNKKNIFLSKKKNYEMPSTVADNNKLIRDINIKKFKLIENFLKIKKIPFNKKNYISNNLESTLVGSVIYGAGYSGSVLLKQLNRYDKGSVSFFVDDDVRKVGSEIDGVKILSFNELKNLSDELNIRNIIIAIPSLGKNKKQILLKKILPLSKKISSLPDKKFYKDQNINVDDISKVSLEELFNKNDDLVPDKKLLGFKNKNILVTGGAGSIGSEVCAQLIKFKPNKIFVLDHSEFNIYRLSQKLNNNKIKLLLGDIKDFNLICNIIEKNKINFIFHAAAYKHVKFLESNIQSAVKNNVLGTYSILKAIKNTNINLIFISTDKAFNPKTILGATKRIGEILVKSVFLQNEYKNCNFSIVRFGNVIGSDGSALPYFLNQIINDKIISLTDKKMERYFMTIREACSLVLQSSLMNFKNKTFFFDMGKPLNIYQIIKKIFDIYKKPSQKLKIKIIGNKFNEKISEKLSFKKSIKKTNVNKIYLIKDSIYNKFEVNDLVQILDKKLKNNNDKELGKFILDFVKK